MNCHCFLQKQRGNVVLRKEGKGGKRRGKEGKEKLTAGFQIRSEKKRKKKRMRKCEKRGRRKVELNSLCAFVLCAGAPADSGAAGGFKGLRRAAQFGGGGDLSDAPSAGFHSVPRWNDNARSSGEQNAPSRLPSPDSAGTGLILFSRLLPPLKKKKRLCTPQLFYFGGHPSHAKVWEAP